MRVLLRKLNNWVSYRVWTDCRHDWHPDGFADWRCGDCGAESELPPDE